MQALARIRVRLTFSLRNPGAGGSFGFADPQIGMGFAYVMNRMDYYLVSDPRELAVREAARECAIKR
jgi:CubicO group peptidase (beta-lactamase class C family)